MGTNYFHQKKKCENLISTGYKKHIGKSSFGWQFLFRGYRDEDLVSYEKWIKELENPDKEIVDEYNETISLEAFKEMVGIKNDGLNHYNVLSNCPMTDDELKYCYLLPDDISKEIWKDDEGHSFVEWDFS